MFFPNTKASQMSKEHTRTNYEFYYKAVIPRLNFWLANHHRKLDLFTNLISAIENSKQKILQKEESPIPLTMAKNSVEKYRQKRARDAS
jgi:hypothetical protein